MAYMVLGKSAPLHYLIDLYDKISILLIMANFPAFDTVDHSIFLD